MYSDLLIHQMGGRLADNIVQGQAQGDEFRTALLWELGFRHFFLHDGRTADLEQAILLHADAEITAASRRNRSRTEKSEANEVIRKYIRLDESVKKDCYLFKVSLIDKICQ